MMDAVGHKPLKSNLLSFARKAQHWCRIGLAAYRLKHVEESQRQKAQQALSHAFAEARGLAMKIGQFMAGTDDLASPYHPLVVGIEPLPLKTILPTLEAQLSQPADMLFADLEESSAAASLGQVHKARLHDGTQVAVKIRYPGMVEAIEAELALSRYLPVAGPAKEWQVDVSSYKAILQRQLLRETDYLVEMQSQQRFRRNLRVAGLVIPEIYADFCRQGVLVQSWEDGVRFHEVCNWSHPQRLQVGKILLMTLLQSLFVAGEIHGDPHPGNYLFRQAETQVQVILLDYGCTVLLTRPKRLALLKLLDMCRHQRYTPQDVLSGLVALGFDASKLEHIYDELPQLCGLLLQPFLVQKPFTVKDWQLSSKLKDLLDERRWWFRSAGPAELFLLLRAFHGLVQQLEKLEVALPWWPLLQYVVGEELLAYARELQWPILPPMSGKKPVADQARKLCVRLTENGVIRIAVDLPAEAAFELETIIPGQVLLLLLNHLDNSLAEVSLRLKSEGLVAQILFDLAVDQKHCQLWLE